MSAAIIAWLIRLITGARQMPDPGGANVRRIYFANHSSHLDAVVIWATLPPRLRVRARPVAAADYWSKSRLHRWLSQEVFQAVLIERKRIKKSDDPIGMLSQTIEEGDDLIIFPEGTRSADGSIGKFKPGIHALALRHPEVLLIPVHLDNLNRILPKGEFLMAPLMCGVIFGHPCSHPPEEESRSDFLTRARQSLLELTEPSPDTFSEPNEH